MIKLSIVIPTYLEDQTIPNTLRELFARMRSPQNIEVIVVDASNSEATKKCCESFKVRYMGSAKGRGIQLGLGANAACSEVIYFLHADTIPPVDFDEQIFRATEQGIHSGCFRLKFHPTNGLLNFYSFFTRFDLMVFRGGDQSLFVLKSLYDKIGGYNTDFQLFEDIDIIQRLRRAASFRVLASSVETSSRKYLINGFFRLQFIFAFLHLKYWLGYSNSSIVKTYNKWIKT